MKYLSIIFALSFLPAYASACGAPPAEQNVLSQELVSRTDNVVLARVTSAQETAPRGRIIYTLEVVETLKGNSNTHLQLVGARQWKGHHDSYSDHHDQVFWNNDGHYGRSSNGPNCEIYPSFSVGWSYLVFLDKPYHSRSFELIRNAKTDRWYKYVADEIYKNPHK